MSGKKNGKKKISQRKKNKSDWKWAKVLGWEIEELKDRLIKVRLATILDCEGHIALHLHKRGYKMPVVCANQDSKPYVMQFKHAFGFGCVMERKKKHSWRYQTNCIQSLIICLVLVDELQLKKDKAMEIIDYYKDKLLSDDPTYRNRKEKLLNDIRRYGVDFKGGAFVFKSFVLSRNT